MRHSRSERIRMAPNMSENLENLTETSKKLANFEKLRKQFSEKLEVIKENYFPKTTDSTQPLTEEVENTTETEEVEEKVDENMSIYVDAMKRHN